MHDLIEKFSVMHDWYCPFATLCEACVMDSVVLNEASFGLICLVLCCLLRGRNSLRNKLWKGWNLSDSPQLI